MSRVVVTGIAGCVIGIAIGAGVTALFKRDQVSGPSTVKIPPSSEAKPGVHDEVQLSIACLSSHETVSDVLPVLRKGDGARLHLSELPPDLLQDYTLQTKVRFSRLDNLLRELSLRKQLTMQRMPEWKEGTPLPLLSDLLAAEVKISDEEVRALYEQEKDRYQQPYEAVEKTLRSTMEARRFKSRLQELRREMDLKPNNDYLMVGPCLPKIAETQNSNQIEVTIVSDYYCPSCRSLWNSLHQIYDGNKTGMTLKNIVYLQAGEVTNDLQRVVSHCSNKLKDPVRTSVTHAMFNAPEGTRYDPKEFRRYMTASVEPLLGQDDLKTFDACVKGDNFPPEVASEYSWIETHGLGDYPNLLINGRRLVPVPTAEELQNLLKLFLKSNS